MREVFRTMFTMVEEFRKSRWYYLCWRILKNNFEGTGTLKEPDGKLYSGEFKDGLPDGYGIQEDPSGVRYMGYCRKVYENGMGTIDFGDGTNFTGQFSNGLAIDGQYDWGDGRITNTSQDENGNWIDR